LHAISGGAVYAAAMTLQTASLRKYKQMVDAWGGWALFQELLETLGRIARRHGVTIPVVAVRYVLDRAAVAPMARGETPYERAVREALSAEAKASGGSRPARAAG